MIQILQKYIINFYRCFRCIRKKMYIPNIYYSLTPEILYYKLLNHTQTQQPFLGPARL